MSDLGASRTSVWKIHKIGIERIRVSRQDEKVKQKRKTKCIQNIECTAEGRKTFLSIECAVKLLGLRTKWGSLHKSPRVEKSRILFTDTNTTKIHSVNYIHLLNCGLP